MFFLLVVLKGTYHCICILICSRGLELWEGNQQPPLVLGSYVGGSVSK